MPALKLIYFDGKGRGEPIRWILAAGKVPFKQEKFGFDQWPARKPGTPYGSVPILEVDGKPLCQTLAIARYAGTLGGLVCSDRFLNAIGDEVVDTMAELAIKFRGFVTEKDAEKQKKDEELWQTNATKVFGVFESRISTKFLLSDKASWQDVFLGHWLSRIVEVRPNALKSFPKLHRVMKNVQELDGIRKYLASPPNYAHQL